MVFLLLNNLIIKLKYNYQMQIVPQFPTADHAFTAAADRLVEMMYQYYDIPVLLMSSGGSNLGLIDALVDQKMPKDLTVSVLDERFSQSPEENTFLQLMQRPFYRYSLSKGVRFIETSVQQGQTLVHHAAEFSRALRSWQEEHPDGVILATIGIGDDGHISGVMPYPEDPAFFTDQFCNPDQWVVGYDAGQKNPYPYRTTTTLSFLTDQISDAVVCVTGAKKQQAWEQLFVDTTDLAPIPSRVLHQMKQVQIYTDRPSPSVSNAQ